MKGEDAARKPREQIDRKAPSQDHGQICAGLSLKALCVFRMNLPKETKLRCFGRGLSAQA